MIKRVDLTKMEKILVVMYEMSHKKISFKYEDIVVCLFKKFKNDFHMHGYPQYPDSGDSTQRSFYTLKKKGLLAIGNKTFTLTDKGADLAKKLTSLSIGKRVYSTKKFDRYVEKEINRIKKLEGLKKFMNSELDFILDTDLYDYLGTTVRSRKSDFNSRLNTVNDVITQLSNGPTEEHRPIIDFHKYMLNRFNEEIKYKLTK